MSPPLLLAASSLSPTEGLVIGFIFGGVIIAYAFTAFVLAKRQKAKRNTMPPDEFNLLRAPGETLRKEIEAISERMFDTLAFGPIAALLLLAAPLWLLQLNSHLNPFALLVSSAALFFAASIVVVKKTVRLIDERAKKRLGYLGERLVGEALLPVIERGYRIFHDVPADMGGWTENLDHVAIGPQGVVVIETKTRSKPTDVERGECVVEFDGTRIEWPRYPSDTKTLGQVARGAAWLQRLIRNECKVEVPIRQVVAIPGWRVNERVCTTPRVVTGRGVAGAVTGASQNEERVLTMDQFDDICARLEERCRDVVDCSISSRRNPTAKVQSREYSLHARA